MKATYKLELDIPDLTEENEDELTELVKNQIEEEMPVSVFDDEDNEHLFEVLHLTLESTGETE